MTFKFKGIESRRQKYKLHDLKETSSKSPCGHCHRQEARCMHLDHSFEGKKDQVGAFKYLVHISPSIA